MAVEDNLLEELLGIANSDAPAEFGSGNLHLSQPLSHLECMGGRGRPQLGTFGMRRSCGFTEPGGQSAAAGFPVVYKGRGKGWRCTVAGCFSAVLEKMWPANK